MNITEDPIFAATAVVCAILFLVFLGTFLRVMPAVLESMGRWKANLEIEDSLQLSKNRNLVAAILYVPLVMIFYHYEIFHPDFLEQIPKLWQFPTVVAIFVAYLLLRAFLNWQIEMQNRSSKTFIAANRSFFNFTILLFLLMFMIVIVFHLFHASMGIERTVLIIAFFALYGFYLFRKGEIFGSVCNPLTTFLYFCTLEIIPTGLMVITTLMM